MGLARGSRAEPAACCSVGLRPHRAKGLSAIPAERLPPFVLSAYKSWAGVDACQGIGFIVVRPIALASESSGSIIATLR